MAIYTNEHLTDLLNEQYNKIRKLEKENAKLDEENHKLAYSLSQSVPVESSLEQYDRIKELERELQTTREQLDTVVKYLKISYQWGLYLYESEEYQEMEDEDEKENMKDDLDIVHSFLNKQKDEVNKC